ASVAPPAATPPITYTWQATEYSQAVTTTDAASHTVSFTWTTTGTKTITVTATNCGGTDTDVVTITIESPPSGCPRPLTGVAIVGPIGVTGTLYVDSLYTFNAVITPTDATPAITYTWSSTPTNGQNHPSATYQWPVSGTYAITLTAENCGGPVDAEPRVVHIAYQENKYIYLPLVLRNHN
ncbi:unnamed protein product, partial [marine sediment metagenome]